MNVLDYYNILYLQITVVSLFDVCI